MADKIKHPKKKRKVKIRPNLDVFSLVGKEEDYKAYGLNQLRRSNICLVKNSRKTNSTDEELTQLFYRTCFFEAACKALGWIPEDTDEVAHREGFDQYYKPPEKKGEDIIVWTKKNLPPDNPIYPNKSVYVLVTNEANATFVACYNYEKEQWENREGKVCRNIIAHHPLNSNQE